MILNIQNTRTQYGIEHGSCFTPVLLLSHSLDASLDPFKEFERNTSVVNSCDQPLRFDRHLKILLDKLYVAARIFKHGLMLIKP